MAPSRPPRPPPRSTRDPKELLKKRGADLIRKISDKDRYAIFLEPVDVDQVEGYAEVIERPMDLSTAQQNLQMGVYRTPIELRADLDLIWSNCCTFNADDSIFYKEAVRLRALAARYYDDFVRVLVRDGVAAALGLTTSRQNGPSSSRLLGKRPPRHRQGSSQSGAGQSSSLLTSEPTSPDGEVEGSASASASGSASAGQFPTFRESQLRRARAASDAAATAASEAVEEAQRAAIAAGVPPKTKSDNLQIFAGPNGVLAQTKQLPEGAHVPRFQVLNHKQIRDSCSEVPLAWRRIGRWHARGATATRFNTKERAREVGYGRMFQRHIAKSAPAARRLLAIVLDAEAVQQHDLEVAARTSGKPYMNGMRSTVDMNGSMSPATGKMSEEKDILSKPVQNGKYHYSPAKRHHDPMDVDYDTLNRPGLNCVIAEKGSKRPRIKQLPRDSPNGTVETKKINGEKRTEHILASHQERKLHDESIRDNHRIPSKHSISRLQALLKEHNIDSSFLTELVDNVPESRKPNATTSHADTKQKVSSASEEINRLLTANHSTMMNVLRLRALREGADEAEREDLEDREREYAECLAKGMSLAVGKFPPRFVVHPVDAAESAEALCQSIQARQGTKKQ